MATRLAAAATRHLEVTACHLYVATCFLLVCWSWTTRLHCSVPTASLSSLSPFALGKSFVTSRALRTCPVLRLVPCWIVQSASSYTFVASSALCAFLIDSSGRTFRTCAAKHRRTSSLAVKPLSLAQDSVEQVGAHMQVPTSAHLFLSSLGLQVLTGRIHFRMQHEWGGSLITPYWCCAYRRILPTMDLHCGKYAPVGTVVVA